MNVKEAVELAKEHIKDLFASEHISNLGLEEVEFDDLSNIWNVTIGFSRPWDTPANALAAIAQKVSPPNRSYKVVSIYDSTGRVLSVKNRETKSWAESA
jgi:hypothetical protein